MTTISLRLEPESNERLANLCGQFSEHIKQVEDTLGVDISQRGSEFSIKGEPDNIKAAQKVLTHLYAQTDAQILEPSTVHLYLKHDIDELIEGEKKQTAIIRTRKKVIRAKGKNQADYLEAIQRNDLVFGIGPAGTGKTYLAVASAVEALESSRVRRLVLVRPAVEAGERLGFLPGDLSQKIDPYLRPMYDALYEMLGFERVSKLMERHVIEVAPLAYMRGRTLNESFIILDEAQNTTIEQMKMFLTRIGFGSTAIVNGDITQTDLPHRSQSGLSHVNRILSDVKGISFNHFSAQDVVRHSLVQKIVLAYDEYDQQQATPKPE